MIIIAVQDPNKKRVYAYNEKEKILNEEGELYNYTSHHVAIKRGRAIYIYDECGKLVNEYPHDFVDMSNISGVII